MTGFPAAALDHVAIPCSDLARSAVFYARLGLTPGFARPGLQQMHLGAGMVELVVGDTPPQEAPVPRHLALRVADLDAAALALRELGIETDGAPRTGASGTQYLFLRDPDGNWVEVVAR
ncbi:VOC family protein [Mesobaculum littorinae]|uniref:VOC family protein n=1 Tax=Mesobaculum littorinae TaxID=2486419 RepID=UPI0013E29EB5|nr:VOC family protein [Mesobaculum littorinae]